MITQHDHTIANHGQTWSVMKNYGTMVNGQPVPWVFNGRKDQNDRNAIERCDRGEMSVCTNQKKTCNQASGH